jgi:hypothetical protein
VLQYLPAGLRVETLRRVRRALRPGGHFVCVFNTGGRFAGKALPEFRKGYADWLLAELDRSGVALPDSRETIRRRTDEFTREMETREGAFGEPEVVDDMITEAGFAIVTRQQIAMPLAASFQTLVDKLSKRRFLTVARSPYP